MLSIPIWGLKVNKVNLLRLGNVDKEIPAAVDKNGKFRNLSSHIKDLNPESINFETLRVLKKIDLENLEEIDKFCNALIKIKKEINLVESSKFDKIDNPLKNAPHTYVELASNDWNHKYSREEAAFPNEYVKNNKYWAPVARVDNDNGDRNLVCSCPSMDEYKDEAA